MVPIRTLSSCQQLGLLYSEWTRAHTCIARYLRSCLFRCQRAVNPLHPRRGTITEGGSCGGLDLEPLGFIGYAFGSQPALSMTAPSTKRQNHMECQSFKTKETCAGHRKACLNEHFYTRSPLGVRAGSRVYGGSSRRAREFVSISTVGSNDLKFTP